MNIRPEDLQSGSKMKILSTKSYSSIQTQAKKGPRWKVFWSALFLAKKAPRLVQNLTQSAVS